MDANDLALLEKLGVEGVLAEMAKGEGRLGRPGSEVREEINHWFAAKILARQDASSAASLAIARRANNIAISAIVLSITTAIIVAVIQFK